MARHPTPRTDATPGKGKIGKGEREKRGKRTRDRENR
jgi:hypothetical protein